MCIYDFHATIATCTFMSHTCARYMEDGATVPLKHSNCAVHPPSQVGGDSADGGSLAATLPASSEQLHVATCSQDPGPRYPVVACPGRVLPSRYLSDVGTSSASPDATTVAVVGVSDAVTTTSGGTDDTQEESVASSSNSTTVIAGTVSTVVVLLLVVVVLVFRMKRTQQKERRQPPENVPGRVFNPSFSNVDSC